MCTGAYSCLVAVPTDHVVVAACFCDACRPGIGLSYDCVSLVYNAAGIRCFIPRPQGRCRLSLGGRDGVAIFKMVTLFTWKVTGTLAENTRFFFFCRRRFSIKVTKSNETILKDDNDLTVSLFLLSPFLTEHEHRSLKMKGLRGLSGPCDLYQKLFSFWETVTPETCKMTQTYFNR